MKHALWITTAIVTGLIAGCVVGAAITGCGPSASKPVVAPNENGANCLAERQILTSTCIQTYATRETIEKCIADAKLPDCTTEAGIAAFVTSRDAGAD